MSGALGPEGIPKERERRAPKGAAPVVGRVAGGIAAPGSHRSRRESLPSPFITLILPPQIQILSRINYNS
jgi:hypothetical protein